MHSRAPKTTAEFMALPVRPMIETRTYIDTETGRTVHVPVVRKGFATPTDPDTVFYCGGFILGYDGTEYFRREHPIF